MKVTFKKYIAKVARYHEDENGNITKELSEIEIKGERIYQRSVEKQIPRECTLVSHGYMETSFEVPEQALMEFCSKYGEPITD